MLKNNKYDYLLDDINGYPLDKHQRKVVFCDKQNTIVIAGAGSGKSTTINSILSLLNYNGEIKIFGKKIYQMKWKGHFYGLFFT